MGPKGARPHRAGSAPGHGNRAQRWLRASIAICLAGLVTTWATGSAADANHPSLDTHRAITHLPMAKGADVVMADPKLGRIYVACSSGAISMFQMDDPMHFKKLADVPVEPRIHSLAVDTRSHRVFAPAEQDRGRPASKMFVFEAVSD